MAFYPINAQGCDSIADLRGQAGTDGVTVIAMGLLVKTDGLGGTFRWDSTSTIADDGITVLAVSGVTTGRWVRLGNSNVVKGNQFYFNIVGISQITVTHNAGIIPAAVFIMPTTSAILTNLWHDKTLDTTTTFTIKFNLLAVLTSIGFDWLAIKI